MGGFGQIHCLVPVRTSISSNMEDSQVVSDLKFEIALLDPVETRCFAKSLASSGMVHLIAFW